MNKKSLLNSVAVVLAVFFAVFAFYCKNPNIESEYLNPKTVATHYNGEQFVGSETCMECHADIYGQHIGTAHFNTSAIADAKNIKGSFEKGTNILDLKDVKFEMRKENDSLYLHTQIKNRDVSQAPSKFDLVIGSGVRGQTYLTWEEDGLYQLQPSYHTSSNTWINSPGYPTYSIKRPISDACLKCHVTYATHTNSKNGNSYDKEKMLYGVDCERCHRPSAKHVVYHRKNPEDMVAKHMLKLTELPKQQRLDACAQCHSGLREVLLKDSPLSYLVGEDLSKHSQNYGSNELNGNLDVHGNQYGLLTKSKCFKQTETMDCSSCHNPHKNQRGETDYFNQKCMACHNSQKVNCKVDTHDMEDKNGDCISCHMPSSPSKIMMAQVGQDSVETSFYIRTHLIGIYPKEEWNN